MNVRAIHLAAAIGIQLAAGSSLFWSPPAAAQVQPLAFKLATESNSIMAAKSRANAADAGFAKFKATVFKEPFPGGVYIVNGDTPIGNDSDLYEFYRREIVSEWKHAKFGITLNAATVDLIVDAPNGERVPWDNVLKKNLSYCVSTKFGPNYQVVVDAMKAATRAWEQASDVAFIHKQARDGDCHQATEVLFDIRPVNVGGKYLARAFFPRSPRPERNVLIDDSSFALPKAGKLQLTGILRHELGHTLAFRHEQTRPEAGACFEDKDWQPLTSYDAFSVMHYPQCNGLSDWSLLLTDKDKVGAACLYGPATPAGFDPANCSGKY